MTRMVGKVTMQLSRCWSALCGRVSSAATQLTSPGVHFKVVLSSTILLLLQWVAKRFYSEIGIVRAQPITNEVWRL